MKTFFFLFVLIFVSCSESPQLVRFSGEAQGTYYAVSYYDPAGTNYQPQIDSILDAFNFVASLWEPQSEINAVNANRDIVVSSLFADLFAKAFWASEQTGGAFDFTVGPLVRAHGFWQEAREALTEEKVSDYLDYVGYEKVQLRDGRIIKTDPRVQLDFNAIAKGYSVDLIGRFLASQGLATYLVDIGGEVLARGRKPDGSKWRIGIEEPSANAESGREVRRVLELDQAALATSGSYRRYYEQDGKRYSHTIDPRTGRPVAHTLLSVTVLDTAVWRADALATAMMVLGEERSAELLKRFPDVEAFFIND